ncbi:MAG: chorismate synthase [Bacteroidales bacterium]|nr:chorismate synthase [Bacteroidales bacterium]
MAGNTFGSIFRLTSFGESHGMAIGGIIDGCPSKLKIDIEQIQNELNRRRPGQSEFATPRSEADKVEFLSGIFEGYSTGAPIAFIIRNDDTKSSDYNHLKEVFRPSHADFTYEQKYGIRDHRGGGRSSARETIARVVAGAIAKQFLAQYGISIIGLVSAIGNIEMKSEDMIFDRELIEKSIIRCPETTTSTLMQNLINATKAEGDTLGGVISCLITGLPAGLGEPVFDKFNADLAKAMLSINAVKGFEIGSGFSGCRKKGSEQNDRFISSANAIHTATNNSGGVQGGLTNGENVFFNVAFKPVATLMQNQHTVDKSGNETVIEGKGRHDVCVVPRAVPIVEAMAALVTIDHFLRNKACQS